jgi:L-asparaginase
MIEKLVFLGMGGTIAGTAQTAGDNVGYTAAQVAVQALLQTVPGLQNILGSRVAQAEQVCQIDSKDLVPSDWAALLDRLTHWLTMPEVVGVVVTHGTDTLEETAYFLSRTLPQELLLNKPVVLTCAMRPASSLAPDGPANMADAAAVALSDGARGVLVVCAGKIHTAGHVQKVHPYRIDAFDSGEAGPMGLVEEGRVRLLAEFPTLEVGQKWVNVARLEAVGCPRVELLFSHAGAKGSLVRALLKADAAESPLRGIVIAGTGNGTIHKDMETALIEAQALGVRVVRASRCAYGQVVGDSPNARSGGFASYRLSAVKARIALMLDIASQA